jgi:effector-binding domain-containing protein
MNMKRNIKMDRILEEVVKFAECSEVRVKITKPQEVLFGMHKGSYQEFGEVFWKLAQWIEENGYEIVGPSVTVCYNDPHTTPEEDMISECQFSVRKRR